MYGYTGEQTDTTGLVFLRARYFAPTQGRFVQRDTWPGDYNRPQTLNGWNYTEGNPINYTDPTGYYSTSSSVPPPCLYIGFVVICLPVLNLTPDPLQLPAQNTPKPTVTVQPPTATPQPPTATICPPTPTNEPCQGEKEKLAKALRRLLAAEIKELTLKRLVAYVLEKTWNKPPHPFKRHINEADRFIGGLGDSRSQLNKLLGNLRSECEYLRPAINDTLDKIENWVNITKQTLDRLSNLPYDELRRIQDTLVPTTP